MPVFAYKAIHDQNTEIESTDDQIDRMCRAGANVLYQRNKLGMHEEEFTSGGARALKWLTQVLDGQQTEPTVGCKIEDVAFDSVSVS